MNWCMVLFYFRIYKYELTIMKYFFYKYIEYSNMSRRSRNKQTEKNGYYIYEKNNF